MAETPAKEQFTFQAEIKQLLHLLSHSLYQNREITIRELVSNASDALDKLRHIQLTDEKFRDDAPLEISIEPDAEGQVLAIRDNGIGMTHDELIKNLGTIAHSGSLEFLKQTQANDQNLSLIGQFGVGFYSAFMLADKVVVLSRSYKDEQGWRWESEGTGAFEIEPMEGLPRGTQVRLHLKADTKEFTETWRLSDVVKKYSTFVPHPIRLGEEVINAQKPIWVEPKSQLTEEKYDGFYQHLTHHTDEKPLWHVHFSSDSPIQFNAILYCPPQNFELLGMGKTEHGIHLCAKRILVQDNNRDLLPEYLRFLYGVVDSADLPLSVSRETLQDNTIFRKIHRVLTKKVLDHLHDQSTEKPEDYLKFYEQYGTILREGLNSDFENRDRISKLLRYRSSHDTAEGQLVSLEEYVKRTSERQKQIYFAAGADETAIRQKPALDFFLKKKLEVLYITDPIDEYLLSTVREFEGKKIVSIDSPDIELPEGEDEDSDAANAEKPAGFERVLQLFKETLGDQVQEVRAAKRLVDSPVSLVNPRGMSTQLEQVFKANSKDYQINKRILEVNPAAPLVQRLCELSANSQHDAFIQDCGRQLFSGAMLLDGLVPDPQELVKRTQSFMQELATSRSPIIS